MLQQRHDQSRTGSEETYADREPIDTVNKIDRVCKADQP